MRPVSVYANLACPAGCPCDVLGALHGPHRVGLRLVMILLSAGGQSASAIAELLRCDAGTVRRWIPPALPAAGPPRDQPCHPAPPGARGGRVAAARLVARGDPDREAPWPHSARASPSCLRGRSCWPRMSPTCTCCPGCAPLDPPRAAPGGHDAWHQPATDHLRRGGPGQRPLLLPGRGKAVSATFTAFLEQLLAVYPSAPVVAVICDNVIIHRSKIVQRWLRKHPRLRVLHGARYSPHDNPIERIWARSRPTWPTARP